jgi:hypothetical protein
MELLKGFSFTFFLGLIMISYEAFKNRLLFFQFRDAFNL